jgi:hypothetical protein
MSTTRALKFVASDEAKLLRAVSCWPVVVLWSCRTQWKRERKGQKKKSGKIINNMTHVDEGALDITGS